MLDPPSAVGLLQGIPGIQALPRATEPLSRPAPAHDQSFLTPVWPSPALVTAQPCTCRNQAPPSPAPAQPSSAQPHPHPAPHLPSLYLPSLALPTLAPAQTRTC